MRYLALVIALILPVTSEGFDLSGVKLGDIHGFVSQGYAQTTSNDYLTHTDDGSFEFGEVGINFNQRLTDQLSAGVQFFFRNLGLDRNKKIVFDWAMADWHYRDWLGVRAGRIKLPYGLHNKVRDADVARTWVLLPQAVYDEGFRDFIIAYWGAELYGVIPAGPVGEFEYEGYGGTLQIDPQSNLVQSVMGGIADGLGASTFSDPLTETRYIAGGRLLWHTPLEGLLLGGTGAAAETEWRFKFPNLVAIPGKPSTVVAGPAGRVRLHNNISTWVVSAVYNWRWMTLSGEYARLYGPLGVYLTPVPGMDEIRVNTLPVDREGFYGACEFEVLENLIVGGYYSVYFPNKKDKGSSISQFQRDADITLRYDPTEYVTLKAEAHRISGVAQLSPLDHPDGFTRVFYLYLAKATVSF